MNSKKYFLIIFFSLAYLISYGQNSSYYYYKGKKTNLELDRSKIDLIVNPNFDINSLKKSTTEKVQLNGFDKNNKRRVTIEFEKELDHKSFSSKIGSIVKDNQILQHFVYFKRLNAPSISISNIFYVKLKDEKDYILLAKVAKEKNAKIIHQNKFMPLWYRLEISHKSTLSTVDISNEFYETGLFEDVDPAFMFSFKQNSCSTNDTNFGSLWGLKNSSNPNIDINICEAWAITEGTGINIAVLDQGIDRAHNDLNDNLSSLSFDTESGISPSVFINGNIHGTHVAGTIGAEKNNGLQVVGVAPKSRLIGISNSLFVTPTVSEELADGINWAVQNNAHIINNSWGDQGGAINQLHSTILEDAIINALTNGRSGLGMIVVFAAGNWGTIDYPANFHPDILTVGSINSSGTRSVFSVGSSGFGNELDLVAPGSNILSTIPGQSTGVLDGTSMAAPHAAGVAALILSKNSCLTVKQVNDILESTAQKVGGYTYSSTTGRTNGNWNNQMGYGLLDAGAAVRAVAVEISGPNTLCASSTYSLTNLPVGAEVSWSVTGTYSISGSNTTNPITVQRTSGGYGVLTANITTSCSSYSITKNLNPITFTITPETNGSCGGTAIVEGATGTFTWTVYGDLLINGTNTTLTTTDNQIYFTGTNGTVEISGGDCSLNLIENFSPYQPEIHFAVNPAYGSDPLSASVHPYNYRYTNIRWYLNGSWADSGSEHYFNSSPPCGNTEVSVEIDLECGITVTGTATFERYCSWWRSMVVYPNPASSDINIQPDAEKLKSLSNAEKSAMKEYEASLYDINGKLLLKGRSNGYKLNLDTRHLKSENYFIHIKIDGEKELIKKQIIIRN